MSAARIRTVRASSVDAVELDEFLGPCPVRDAYISTPSTRAIVWTTSLIADRRAGREIDGAASVRAASAQEPVNRVVDVHEVDQVLAVAAHRELALAGHHRPQPTRRDLARRLRTARRRRRTARSRSCRRHAAVRRRTGRTARMRASRSRTAASAITGVGGVTVADQAVVDRAGRGEDQVIHGTMLEEIHERRGVLLEIPARPRRRRRGVAVGGEIERGVGPAANGGGHGARRRPRRQVALDGRDVREAVPRDERLEIRRVMVERQDLPACAERKQHVVADEARRAGDDDSCDVIGPSPSGAASDSP